MATRTEKDAAAKRPVRRQRVRTVRLATQLRPDLLVPYLYGERGGRSINDIVQTTGCTVDYCALSPDEPERDPQTLLYVMNFLVAGEQLEEATRQLTTLVERVQVHLQKKRKATTEPEKQPRSMMSPTAKAMDAAKKDAVSEERWEESDAMGSWDVEPAPRMYYAGGNRYRRQRPRFVKVTDVDTDEKGEFVMADEATYMQRQEPAHFVPRRRVRRYPDPTRWPPRSYERPPAHFRNGRGYTRYAVELPDGEDSDKRVSRQQQSRYVYQGAPNQFTAQEQAEYSLYEYEGQEEGEGNDVGAGAEFNACEDTVDLANEVASAAESTEYVDVQDHRPTAHQLPQPQPLRRGLKRPLTKMRSNMPPPPPIYRQRMPYIYEYAYDDEDDEEWMSDDEEVAVAYGYPPQYHPVELPVIRRRRPFDGVGSVHQWGSPSGRRMVKRRRIPHNALPLETEKSESPAFTGTDETNPSAAHGPTSMAIQQDESMNLSDHTLHQRIDSEAEAENDRSGVGDRDENQSDNVVVKPRESSASKTSFRTSSNDGLSERGIVNGSAIMLAESIADITQSEETHLRTQEQENFVPSELPQAHREMSRTDDIEDDRVETSDESEITPTKENTAGVVSQELLGPSARTTPASPSVEECRVASLAAIGHNSYDHGDSMMEGVDNLSGRDECVQPIPCTESESLTAKTPTVQDAAFIGAGKVSSPSVAVSDPQAESRITDTIRINNHVIASLERMNKVDATFETAKAALTTQTEKFRGLESSNKSCRQLAILCDVVYDLQCRIGSRLCSMDHTHKHALLTKLDSILHNLQTDEKTEQEKVESLQADLELVLSMSGVVAESQAQTNVASTTNPNNTTRTTSEVAPEPPHSDQIDDEPDAPNWEDDAWFEETHPSPPMDDQDEFVAHISPKKSNMKLEGEYLLVKLEDGASTNWPRQLPSFVWSLLARVSSSDPQSYVMRVTHKRLLDEIAKGDPYYYLHPLASRNDDRNPVDLSAPTQPCEFGCRGGSALKWERKLVSQISSRMKSFDNVAYSLARSSGGKEVLNRKKMNSIIRKLHLVAMQLHSLISHLYCVKGEVTCKEVDSLPVALNNSHFERKMGVYKSRLKLVVPHKHQQQQAQQQQQNGSMEPTEELLRDTYEFFPELLLCVDIWGYNYRESQAKQQSSRSLLAGDKGLPEGESFPIGFFRRVENHAFDFEHDGNSFLRRICDELLNIVCLWNDFKWTDNLEGVALERVVAFEKEVTVSIVKILELHAHHLQALWAIRLLDDPERLRSVHFTHLNAYYSDRSQGSLTPTSATLSPGLSRKHHLTDPNADSILRSRSVEQLVANEIVEQRLAEEYWKHKVAVLSSHDPIDDAIETGEVDQKAAQMLTAEAICSWDQPTLVSYLMRWSDVYVTRNDMRALSSVTSHMLKHEMQKYKVASRAKHSTHAAVDTGTKQLLAAVNRAQMLIRDTIVPSEKLALHCASSQLPEEKRRSSCEEIHLEADSSGGEETFGPSRSATNSEAGPNDQVDSETANNEESNEDASSKSRVAPEQPELQDLIQLLAVTKREMQELCSHRPRSARMREKLQTQSLLLARQTVEIFRNIRNMYGAQRR